MSKTIKKLSCARRAKKFKTFVDAATARIKLDGLMIQFFKTNDIEYGY